MDKSRLHDGLGDKPSRNKCHYTSKATFDGKQRRDLSSGDSKTSAGKGVSQCRCT